MKTVVIGDLHGRSTWKLITHLENPDRVVFIGDYFDSFIITPVEQIKNFEELIRYKETAKCEVVMLIGNHDYHYFPEVGNVGTSGYQTRMAPTLQHLIDDNRHHLQLVYQMNEYLFSHAGVSSDFMDAVYGKDGWQTESIANDLNEMFRHKPLTFDFGAAASIKKISYLDPHGDNKEQSPLWIRPRSLMRANRETLKKQVIQVVGHTQVRKIDEEGKSTGNRYWFIDALDTSGQYIVITNKGVKVKST